MSGEKPSGFEERLRRKIAADSVLIGGAIATLLLLLYLIRDFINPIILAAAMVIILWPIRKQRAAKAIMLAAGLLVAVYSIQRLAIALTPFVIALLMGYLFNPLVVTLDQRFRIPRWFSSVIVTSLIVGFMSVFILLLIPNLLEQLGVLGARIIDSVGDIQSWLLSSAFLDRLETSGLIEKEEFISSITTAIHDRTTTVVSTLPETAQSLLRSLGSLVGLVTVVAIIPVLILYTLKDYELIMRRLLNLFPPSGGKRDYLLQATSVVANYVRGQLTISAIAAFNVSLALVLFDVPFALLIGLLAGLLNMIPSLGIIVTNIVGITIAIVFGDPWFAKAIIVFLVLLGQQLLEQSVLTPHIMSQRVGLHPVLVLLSLFVFGSFMGVVGLIIAVPATALLLSAFKAWREQRLEARPEAVK